MLCSAPRLPDPTPPRPPRLGVPQGVLRMGQEVEVRPGVVTKDAAGAIRCLPIRSRIVSLFAEQNPLQFAAPGGLIGVGTTVDPTLTRADRLVGQVLGGVGQLPDVFTELEINFFLLRRLLGVRTSGDEKQGKVRLTGWGGGWEAGARGSQRASVCARSPAAGGCLLWKLCAAPTAATPFA